MITNLESRTAKIYFFVAPYFTRKILQLISKVLIFIVIILAIVQISDFSQRINWEIDFVSKGSFTNLTKAEILEIARNKSTSLPLWPIFISLISLVIVFGVILFALILAQHIHLWRQFGDLKVLFKFIFTLSLLVFVLIFFIIALQPNQVEQNISVKIGQNTVTDSIFSDYPNYSKMWVSLAFSFIILILQIMAKSKFGSLGRDKILAKKPFDTTKVENQINEIIQKNTK
ncbi:Uncharacterised protein [Mesomycoplasma dispar]|uniref:Transmembrane protein n=1 Tax=Mesomycoplasma dispar TaxID=86660 RepID=A0AAJ5TCD0_9BACT|nr:hypothetical protein [Mesomycoplasma dispar]AJR12588.1 hypothetical protein MDIS_03070 [Mesomycoplasma dispar]VEU62178.1 Uncharacterised protein [Mesomycoplasma dispar]